MSQEPITNFEISKQMWNHTLIVENIVHLGGIGDWDCMPDTIRDFFDLADDKDLMEFFGLTEEEFKKTHITEHLDEPDAVGEYLIHYRGKRLGFFVQFTTPIMTPYLTDIISGGMHSWGMRRTKWFYGETLYEAYNKGFKWTHEMRLMEKEELLKNSMAEMDVATKAKEDIEKFRTHEDYQPFQIPL